MGGARRPDAAGVGDAGRLGADAVEGRRVEQIIRPTGLVDPQVAVRPAAGQVDDLLGEIRTRVAAGERVLVTTLTKRMAEELTDYYAEHGVRVRYLHSDIQTIERTEIIRQLREGGFDVLVGITCCARASTSRRSRWSRSSTRTRKGSCARRAR